MMVCRPSEPEQLRRGKRFQAVVQQDFTSNTKDGVALPEAFISFDGLIKTRRKSGRMDIFIAELGDFVTVIEIKATDWDKIKPRNVKKNLHRHVSQILRYVEKFIEVDDLSVCLGIIYPTPPQTQGLRDLVESYVEAYGVPAYWYSEIKTPLAKSAGCEPSDGS